MATKKIKAAKNKKPLKKRSKKTGSAKKVQEKKKTKKTKVSSKATKQQKKKKIAKKPVLAKKKQKKIVRARKSPQKTKTVSVPQNKSLQQPKVASLITKPNTFITNPLSSNANILKEEKPIGRVVHYFDKIGVAVIAFDESVGVGEKIRIVGGEHTDFEQEVSSIEIDHQKLERVQKGQEAGIKVNEKVHEGYKVYRA